MKHNVRSLFCGLLMFTGSLFAINDPFDPDGWPTPADPTKVVHFMSTDGTFAPLSSTWSDTLNILTGGDQITAPITLRGRIGKRVVGNYLNIADSMFNEWANDETVDILMQVYGNDAVLGTNGEPRNLNFLTGVLPELAAPDGGRIYIEAHNHKWNWVLFRIPNGTRPSDGTRFVGSIPANAQGGFQAGGVNGGTIRAEGVPNLVVRVVAFGERGAFGEPDDYTEFEPPDLCDPDEPLLVTTLNDGGAGSLREAISVLCSDRIRFDASLRGQITLTSGELFINTPLSIVGPGAATLTISGNNASRVFHIGSQGNVDISGITITEGRASAGGGGIAMEGGSLTVSNCAITGCYAQGGASQGGGAIAVVGAANLAIIASTLSSNTTPYYGGGIYLFNGPNVSLVNSTVSGNRTLDGSFDDAFGGGVFVHSSTLNVTNSTIANNSSASAGGGIYKPPGTVALRNSLVAGNSAPTGPDCNGTFVSIGYNLIGNTGGSSGFGSTGDQLNVNPLIGPLQDNGGPTFTHALLAGSPAIDKGGSGGPATDQRGGVRPLDTAIANATGGDGDGSDIGAVESGGYLRITDLRTNGPQVNISFTTDPGWPYSLESKDALVIGPWTLVPGSARTGNGTVLTVPDTRPRVPKRFYRAVMTGPPTQLVYSNNFEGAVGAEWSVPQAVSTTPLGGRKFLGEFPSTVVTLQLANLPAHTHLSISFDLFILKSWDGNRTDFGPDTFQLTMSDGPTLIGSTFSTYTTQSYPGALTDSFPANTGAVEINTLGYTHPNLGPADAVYRLTATVNHTASSVTLDFSGVNLQDIADESWGLDNVRVETIDIP